MKNINHPKSCSLKALLTLLILWAPLCLASQHKRYYQSGNCYHLDDKTSQFNIFYLGNTEGNSGYDCANAHDNLVRDCSLKAKAQGYSSGIAYQDVQIAHRSYEQKDIQSSESYSDRRGLFGWTGGHTDRKKQYLDHSSGGATDYTYLPLSECHIDKNFPQERVPTLRTDDYRE